jgi:hypothetical protein
MYFTLHLNPHEPHVQVLSLRCNSPNMKFGTQGLKSFEKVWGSLPYLDIQFDPNDAYDCCQDGMDSAVQVPCKILVCSL